MKKTQTQNIKYLLSNIQYLISALWLEFSLAGDIEQDTDGGQEYRERRASIGDEGQWNPRQGDESGDGGYVHESLDDDPRNDTDTEKLAETIRRILRDTDTPESEEHEKRDEHCRPDKSEFLPENRENGIRDRLGEIIEFLMAISESHAEKSPGTDRDERLRHLITESLRIMLRIHVYEESLHSIRSRLQEDEEGKQCQPCHPRDMLQIRS